MEVNPVDYCFNLPNNLKALTQSCSIFTQNSPLHTCLFVPSWNIPTNKHPVSQHVYNMSIQGRRCVICSEAPKDKLHMTVLPFQIPAATVRRTVFGGECGGKLALELYQMNIALSGKLRCGNFSGMYWNSTSQNSINRAPGVKRCLLLRKNADFRNSRAFLVAWTIIRW